MEVKEIRDERDLYRAVREYAANVWRWGAAEIDEEHEPTPEEFIEILTERIEWVKAHSAAVDRYLRRRIGRTRIRIVDGSREEPR